MPARASARTQTATIPLSTTTLSITMILFCRARPRFEMQRFALYTQARSHVRNYVIGCAFYHAWSNVPDCLGSGICIFTAPASCSCNRPRTKAVHLPRREGAASVPKRSSDPSRALVASVHASRRRSAAARCRLGGVMLFICSKCPFDSARRSFGMTTRRTTETRARAISRSSSRGRSDCARCASLGSFRGRPDRVFEARCAMVQRWCSTCPCDCCNRNVDPRARKQFDS
eukprot:2583322-Pleurochrysis_carterae.AAC.5